MSNLFVLQINNLNVNYQSHHALKDISLTLPLEGIVGIVGPNGAGKSTFLKTLCGLMRPSSGSMSLNNQDISHFQSKMAYVPQKREMNLDFPILVEEVVAQGSLGKKKWYQGLSKQDYIQAHKLLEKLDLLNIAKKSISDLSGGQQQRVFLARALMQEAQVLFLDEPFVGLDIVSEEKLVSELKKLAAQGMAIFIVHHDLNSWKKYFDQLILLKSELIACGDFHKVFTQDHLFKAYGINLREF
jgi:ABC-type Mn2+/Zn2+ transport system ATPase subunit